jgi:hypothetical protein
MIKNYLNEKHDIEIIDKYIKSSPKFKKNSLSLNNIWRGKNINERERSEQEELFELKEIEKRFIFELRQKKGNGFNEKYVNSLSNLLYNNTRKNYSLKRLKLIESNNQNSFSKNNSFLNTKQNLKPLDLINKRLNNQKCVPIDYINSTSKKNIFKKIKLLKKNKNYHSYTNIKKKIYFSPDDIQLKEPDEIENYERKYQKNGFLTPTLLKFQKKIINLNFNNNNENIITNSIKVTEPFRKEFFRNLFNKMKKEKRYFDYKKYSN